MTRDALNIDVHNEIGRLRDVVVHCPGEEIVRMTQYDLDRMLFDDILAPEEAAHEHGMMVDVMRAAGARVHELDDLLALALSVAPEAALAELLDKIARLSGATGIAGTLATWGRDRLARALVEGVPWTAFTHGSLARLRAEHDGGPSFALRPLPNLMFLRDPCISVYDRILVGRMATPARAREPLLIAFALRHATGIQAPLSFPAETGIDDAADAIEGGDVLVLSPELLLIGVSERTRASTIERLVHEHLFPAHPRLARVYAVMMPQARSVMHLDTILTQVDRELFLGHAPLVATRPGLVARLTRDREPERLPSATVLDLLREEHGSTVGLVPCGGRDLLHQEREQWTDGANAVALAPGKIMLYARNRWTVAALAEHGFVEVRLHVEEPADARRARVAAAMTGGRTVFTWSGSELSRARGGGRCLTMPLARDPT